MGVGYIFFCVCGRGGEYMWFKVWDFTKGGRENTHSIFSKINKKRGNEGLGGSG